MLRNILSVIVLVTAFAFNLKAQNINTTQSEVLFKIKNMKIRTVEGVFTGMTGFVDSSKDNINKIEACIPANTVNTESKKRDEHLKNEDFFYVEKFPEICFTSSNVKHTNEGYLAYGELTLHGVSKHVEIPITKEGNKLKGSINLNRLDYKLGESTGTFMVGDEVEITIICVLE